MVICQKSKILDWCNHFKDNYPDMATYDLTNKKECDLYIASDTKRVGIINYDLIYRRSNLLKIKYDTMLLDESSMIQNERTKRAKAILKMKHDNVILLSGTPCAGRYERLHSQMLLLGWRISKTLYWEQYIITKTIENQGFPIKIVTGYKNVDRLKEQMRKYGCRFLKSESVFDLPKQIFNKVTVAASKEYRKFRKDRIVTVKDREFVGDSTLTKLLYERVLCGSYSQEKLAALKDLMNSTEDRLIIFYNFNEELRAIEDICIELDKPMSIVCGLTKDLSMYEEYENSVTAIQVQAGSHGLNLQKANKIAYFTPPLSSELFEQSKKRTHRIKQERTCFYYLLIVKDSIEEKIYQTLEMRKDFTDFLFIQQEEKQT